MSDFQGVPYVLRGAVCVSHVCRIDDDIETARLNMEAGEEQLIKKHNSLSYKWLAIKVFAILFLFIVLFLLFVA